MLPRYINNFQILLTNENRRYYTTNIVSSVPEDIFQYTIVAQDGDRLDTLAARYYGDAAKWWIIAKANNIVDGTFFVQGGTELIIPSAGLT